MSRNRASAKKAGTRPPCERCGKPRAKGRTRYCGDECRSIATVERTRKKDDQRLQACQRCQGPKEPGTRGAKYCEECRRIIADSAKAHETERARRRHRAEMLAREEQGYKRRRRSDAPEGQKWCARCQNFHPLASFAKNSGRPTAYCIPCQKSYNQERRLWHNFGMTWDEYDLLFACQEGRCAICGGRPRRNALSVDHDHATGEIRGLLCSRCNHKLLGSANDDPARLRKAADYLEAFIPRDVFGEPRIIPGFEEDIA